MHEDNFQSDSVDDLLVRGEAAVAAGDKDEARFYLEWALRAEPDLDQEARANFGLSRVADNPAQRRDYLESVLAAYPNHPEARRDLAILDGRLKPEEIVDARSTEAGVAQPGQIVPADLQTYKCPRCGGAMSYSPERRALYCQFCGYTQALDKQARNSPVQQQDWEAAIYTQRGHTWALPQARSVKCQNCGATYTMSPSSISAQCPFCGSPQVVVSEDNRALIEPVGIIPFANNAAQALSLARQWLNGARLRPDDLDEKATFTQPRGAYLPFWAFDVTGEMNWRGVVYQEEFGHAVPVPTSGTIPALFNDIMVGATKSLPSEALDSLQFNMTALMPYAPDLLADWPTEIYAVSLSDAAVLAHEKAFKKLQEQAGDNAQLAAGASVHELRIETPNISVTSYKLVLLPIWITEYIYKEKRYRVVVNGQTGAVEGSVARSKLQSFLDSL